MSALRADLGSRGEVNFHDKARSVVGQPQFMATWPDGRLAVEWAHGTYQIALVFKDNACEGVLGEQVVQPQYSTGVSSGVIIGE